MLEEFLLKKLSETENAGLLRTLNTIQSNPAARIEINGRKFINFSSNNYLDLVGNKEINKAVAGAVEKYGFAGTSSRLICGNLSIHEELEAGLVVFKNKQASLVFPSGYQTNVGYYKCVDGKREKFVHNNGQTKPRFALGWGKTFRQQNFCL
ncbi:hypothetical protein ATZ36_14400 [Candidatus Endomicrobiellum trichonymphae]|uniref:Aminotransferase class I/classII large domain-containing protein n=1 Tax=Endomicrobium trichonymphae TaxID=1408204 RepID=A0A1E5IM09_ENDTX|nr:hypothetical protein ATZ36_14400 [Candidatus Endomicrobium trichonymphae]